MLFPANRLAVLAMLLLLSGMLASCSGEDQPKPSKPSTEVGTYTVKVSAQAVSLELPGRTSAYMAAQIRPQVGGIIQQRLFKEGEAVKAGQALYQIDPQSYRAALAEARASVASAKATLRAAELKAKRDEQLIKIDAISAEDNESAQEALLQARATLQSAQAAVKTAQINLDYTRITAPIAGRTSASTVTPGALVTAAQDTALTTVQQLDPIYVDVTQTSAQLLRLKRDLAKGLLSASDARDATTIQLILEDGSLYEHPGTLTVRGLTVDEGTGSVTLRAEVPNPDGLLLPGMYVKARIQEAVQQDALLIPQQAVTRDARGDATALVVVDGKVEQRQLALVEAVGNQWWVSSGLGAGDQLIVEGLQKIQIGDQVKAKPVDVPATQTASAQ
ncbi:efflux RND transporter periplasmic adaptor subunit [Pseudomonas sp. MAG002Y]|uniref:efflux RND transporter periplasmic adaptor subunit n=1 Tax=Pseudomonas sp. MAG002Y TaxID=2678690 RepID=UPI001C60FD41|nr:efflux RND transporter periplasmic adaptor subunit [Pseudomonas sp. MAG002Y]MBW5415231.1 efflux RND transporter periplasmic adaptor subunit [Pseudomonas sp. MAG002Y]